MNSKLLSSLGLSQLTTPPNAMPIVPLNSWHKKDPWLTNRHTVHWFQHKWSWELHETSCHSGKQLSLQGTDCAWNCGKVAVNNERLWCCHTRSPTELVSVPTRKAVLKWITPAGYLQWQLWVRLLHWKEQQASVYMIAMTPHSPGNTWWFQNGSWPQWDLS